MEGWSKFVSMDRIQYFHAWRIDLQSQFSSNLYQNGRNSVVYDIRHQCNDVITMALMIIHSGHIILTCFTNMSLLETQSG